MPYTMHVQSKACCTHPPVTLSGGYDYKLKGKYIEIEGLKTYRTGSPTSRRGVFVVYDVFGLYIQALRGADILASGFSPIPDEAGNFQVFMPDFFGEHPQDMSNFPPKTPQQFAAIKRFMLDDADPPKTVKLIKPLLDAIMKEHPEIDSWAICGFCWGGKVAALVSGPDSIFKAAAQCHPSLLDVEDAQNVHIPMCILPSMDEDIEVMDKWIRRLKITSPKSYTEYFSDQVHGWMTSRAGFNDLHKFEEYLRGYRIVRSFFAGFV